MEPPSCWRRRGLQGASFAEVLELTKAPRGSIYHHFPNGKDELVTAALNTVSGATMDRLSQFDRDAVAITEGFVGLWSDLLDRAQLTAGCAVVAVSVAASGDLLDHAGEVFGRWTNHLSDLLQEAGLNEAGGRGLRRAAHRRDGRRGDHQPSPTKSPAI